MNLPEAFSRLRSTVEFQTIMREAENVRPLVFSMDPKKPFEQEAAMGFYNSGQLNGFDLLFQCLTGVEMKAWLKKSKSKP